MGMFGKSANRELAQLKERVAVLSERWSILDEASGVGLWEAVLHNGDSLHAESKWLFSNEFRRMLGFQNESEFPNLVQSWSDRLHPDDVANTFANFERTLKDKSGRTRYHVRYRMKMRDGTYRWFAATGGCVHQADGTTVRASGSCIDVHEQVMAEQSRAEEAENDRIAITALLEGLEALANGDLTFRVTTPFAPKATPLKDNLNKAAGQLLQTMLSVEQVVGSMHGGSSEISRASDDLSRRTEQQAASLEETAAALDEITATVKKTAEGASQVARATANARTEAENSGAVVENATTAMAGIEASSNQISQIIGVIDEIAFQTNLLALNAGVEAARAGDAGKGFAVVAQEVRELAQRSANAAKEIKALITASSQQVELGVKLVDQTGSALKGIVGQITQVADLVSEIASSTQEQSTGLHQINTAVNQMDQMTQQNAAMVEETSASSHSLASEANELTRLLAQFRLRLEGQGAAHAPRRYAA